VCTVWQLPSSRIAACFGLGQTFLPALREALQQPVTMRCNARREELCEQQPLRSRRQHLQHLQSIEKERRWLRSGSQATIAPANSQASVRGSRMAVAVAPASTPTAAGSQPSRRIADRRHHVFPPVFQVWNTSERPGSFLLVMRMPWCGTNALRTISIFRLRHFRYGHVIAR
jgi:hypothetical protein